MRSLSTATAPAMRGLHPAASVSCFQLAPSVDDQTALLADACASRPPCQPPITHILSLNASVIGKSECFHAAASVARVHSFPSADDHTSRGGSLNESTQPPRIHIRPLWTSSPHESRGVKPFL